MVLKKGGWREVMVKSIMFYCIRLVIINSKGYLFFVLSRFCEKPQWPAGHTANMQRQISIILNNNERQSLMWTTKA